MKKYLFLLITLLTISHAGYAQDDYVKVTLKGQCNDQKLLLAMTNNTNAFFHAIQDAVTNGTTPVISEKIMTPECMQTVMELWANSQFYCPQTRATGHLTKILNADKNTKDKNAPVMEIRDIPVEQEKAEGEPLNINLTCNKAGVINGLTIGLSPAMMRSIMRNNTGQLDEVRRQIVASFLENFRTAYNRKDIDFLEKVYSNDALIITGQAGSSKIQTKKTDNGMQLSQEKDIQYVKQTKQQYISRLRGVFQKNTFINVDFENIDIHLHPNKDFDQNVYCVALDQSWTSAAKSGSMYHDDGYLFLIIDFHDQDKPLIQIRVWQPQEDVMAGHKMNENNLGIDILR